MASFVNRLEIKIGGKTSDNLRLITTLDQFSFDYPSKIWYYQAYVGKLVPSLEAFFQIGTFESL